MCRNFTTVTDNRLTMNPTLSSVYIADDYTIFALITCNIACHRQSPDKQLRDIPRCPSKECPMIYMSVRWWNNLGECVCMCVWGETASTEAQCDQNRCGIWKTMKKLVTMRRRMHSSYHCVFSIHSNKVLYQGILVTYLFLLRVCFALFGPIMEAYQWIGLFN